MNHSFIVLYRRALDKKYCLSITQHEENGRIVIVLNHRKGKSEFVLFESPLFALYRFEPYYA